jgi:large subunit ribosomal protein L22
MKAHTNNLRITPKKINVIAHMVRGKSVVEAQNLLKFTPKKAAKILAKLIDSAAANAENNFKQEIDSLYIKEITVGKGVTFKRGVSVSRGRVHPLLKRNANVSVTIGVKEESEKTVTKSADVSTEATTEKADKTAKSKKTSTTKKTSAKKTVKA